VLAVGELFLLIKINLLRSKFIDVIWQLISTILRIFQEFVYC